MISRDTNVLLHACNSRSPLQAPAEAFLRQHATKTDFAIVLLRNPAVVANPRYADQAAEICRGYRRNPCWRVLDYPGNLMEEIWRRAGQPDSARRSIFDVRLALTLRHHGVTRFATGNVKHFGDYGFERVWNPLSSVVGGSTSG